jgi:hypothetical protein
MYNVDFDKTAEDLTPPLLRKSKMIAWLKVLVSQIIIVYNSFLAFMDAQRLELSYNFQTQHMERMLNDKYPDAANGIYIDNSGSYLPIFYTFFQSEGQPHLDFTYFNSEAMGYLDFTYSFDEYAQEYDFKVMVPSALVFDQDEMKAFINKYKVAGMRYQIITF